MEFLRSALLYTALFVGANAAIAQDAGQVIRDAGGADMKGLKVLDAPVPLPEATFEDGTTLAEYEGRIVVLNFWAVWCAPCREEMPTLSALQGEFGGDDFAVVTVASGPNPAPAVDKFLGEIGVDNLAVLRDPKSVLARGAGVFGLPVTVILDRSGAEVARLVGPADWHSDQVREIVSALIAS